MAADPPHPRKTPIDPDHAPDPPAHAAGLTIAPLAEESDGPAGATIAPLFDSDDDLLDPAPRGATLHTLYPDVFDQDAGTEHDDGDPRPAPSPLRTSVAPAPAPMPPAPKELRPGTTLGRWVLEARIGEGATASVWSAHHHQLGSPVAIKIFHRQEMSFHTVLGEARAAAGIPSPNTIWVYDVDTLEGHHAIVMELCADGDRVAESLRVAQIDGWRHAATLISQAARGVEAAHEGAVFHKDIKPANILVNPSDGRAQITDFGLANPALWRARASSKRRSAQATVAFDDMMESPARAADPHAVIRGSVRVGTPEFMAPEQAEGLRNDIDPRDRVHRRYLAAIDVYGLGATLYTLLAGRPPYPIGELPEEGTNAAAIMTQVVSEAPLPIQSLAPDVPRRLRKVLEKAMARDPFDRYPSAAALADDLDALTADHPTSLDTSPLVRIGVHMWRERATVTLIALLGVITLASSAIVWSNAVRIGAQAEQLQAQTEALTELELAHAEAQQYLGAARSQLSTTQATLAQTRSELTTKDGQLVETRSALETSSRDLATTSERLTETEQQLLSVDAQLLQATMAIGELETRLSAATNQRDAARASLEDTKDELAHARSLLITEVTRTTDLTDKVEALQAQIARGAEALKAAEAVEAEARAKVADADARLREASAHLRELRDENAQLRRLLAATGLAPEEGTTP